MSLLETKAKIQVIHDLSVNKEIQTICDVIAELVNRLEDKQIGFKPDTKIEI